MKHPSEPEKLIPSPLQTIFITASLTSKLEKAIDARVENVRKVKTQSVNKPSQGIRHEFVVAGPDKKGTIHNFGSLTV